NRRRNPRTGENERCYAGCDKNQRYVEEVVEIQERPVRVAPGNQPKPPCRLEDDCGNLPHHGVPLAAASSCLTEGIKGSGEWDENDRPSEEPGVAFNHVCLPEGSVLPNGSRLSCGRLAHRRKGGGRSPCPARGTTLRFL